MRRISLAAAVVWALSAPLLAANFFYELQLVGQGRALARDYPVERGSVLLFHSYPTGTFTSVPREAVLRVVLRVSDRPARALEPGETIAIGATGGQSGADATVFARRAGTPPASVERSPYGYGAGAGAYAYGIGSAPPRNSPAVPGSFARQPIGTNGFPGDLPRAASGEPPTIGANGYPVAPGTPGAAPLPVGPNGFPAPAPPANAPAPPPPRR